MGGGDGPWDIFWPEDRFSFPNVGRDKTWTWYSREKVLNMVLKFHPNFQGLGSKAISVLLSDAFSFYPKYKAALLYLQYSCNFFANQNLDYPKSEKSKHQFTSFFETNLKISFWFFRNFGLVWWRYFPLSILHDMLCSEWLIIFRIRLFP